ncbi:MAG TPA: polyphosphate kinase 1 [Woeseiaceae bacterium]|nr:polyphosphate kinase 1 [Woeseiaceae bacterium]
MSTAADDLGNEGHDERQEVRFDPEDPALYLNRELTWLAFNRRVLTEAERERNPLLEQLKFLAIVGSNLDEFFMKRIGGLKQQQGAGVSTLTVDGRTPTEQIAECYAEISDLLADQSVILAELMKALADDGIRVLDFEELDDGQREQSRAFFEQSVFPLLTPLVIDSAHPFPFISNLSVNLLVQVCQRGDDKPSIVRIKVPLGERTPRFVQLGPGYTFVPLEQIIEHHLDLVLPGVDILSCDVFRVTRNAVVERDEEQANDLLELIESELRERRFAPVVRLEVNRPMSAEAREYLSRQLELTSADDIFETDGLLGRADYMQLAGLPVAHLLYPPHTPAAHERLARATSVFEEIRANGPLLLQHPYQSFTKTVIRLLREAVADPAVLAIKTTLYRTSEDSQIVPLLIDAVTNGKQVAVVVELKARFDEAANIRWANRLEEAGIHVSYGVVGYKAHAKMMLIVRDEGGRLQRYVHVGTGNYHSGTARQYCDLGVISADADLGADASEFFNSLTTGSPRRRNYRRLVTAPDDMKPALLDRIRREAEHRAAGREALIQLKTNALEDPDVTCALYEASRAGVPIQLIVRDTCRLRPGLPGISETVTVRSLVGRFLEHTRVYYFRNAGDEEYFIGSADCMSRNLTSRVETLLPIREERLRETLRHILDLQLADTENAWEMLPDGDYVHLEPGEPRIDSQQLLAEWAQEKAHSPAL